MRIHSFLMVWGVSLFYMASAQAHSHGHGTEPITELGTVVVSSTTQGSVYDVAQPATVLSKDDLAQTGGSTLGQVLENVPGLANASFGAGVGRPVIRGMGGSRVKILQNGSDSADVSAMSSDHAPMAEASSAQQVEILYGPATLLYGGGAVGGVVNLVDQRIAEQPKAGVSGEISAKGSSVDNGYSSEAALKAGRGHWVLHLDGFKRDANDYRSAKGKVFNSDSQGQGGAVALSWADGHSGFVGASISTLDYDYAVPNTEGEAFRVQPKQTRYDLKGAWLPAADSPWRWIEEWRTELSFNDYEHQETEPGLAVGLFDQDSVELNSRIRHQSIGQWQGTFGVQLKRQELALCHDHHGCDGIPNYTGAWDGSMGSSLQSHVHHGVYFAHATPMPKTTTEQAGLFWLEQLDGLYGTFELGARLDQVRIRPDASPIQQAWRQESGYYADNRFTPITLSAAGTLVIDEYQRVGLSLARAQRTPQVSELYWNGDHHAIFAYQLDNPELDLETAYTLDLNWQYVGEQNHAKAALFYYYFEDYIYNALQSFSDPFHGEDVYRHEQADARFYGAELSFTHHVNDRWHLDLAADAVSAKRTDGQALPRTPPGSVLAAINWEKNGWQTRLESKALMKQSEVASNETATAGFVLMNAYASYQQLTKHGQLTWRASVQNLTDEYSLNHVSYLKRAAPMPGRNVQLGLTYKF